MQGEELAQRRPGSTVFIQRLTSANLEQAVPERGIAMIEFTTRWCSVCESFQTAFSQAALEHPGTVFGQVDVEQEKVIARRFSINAVPTLAVIHDRALVFRHVGALPYVALQDLLRQVRQLAAGSTGEHEGHTASVRASTTVEDG